MRKLKFAAGITLYNPQAETIEHINDYLDSFDTVLVFDNSDKRGKEHDTIIDKFSKESRLVYIDGKENCGLPFAYNTMIADKRIADFDYICTLDQDSIFKHEDIEVLKDYIENHHAKFKNKVAEIAPYIDYGRKRDKEHKKEKRKEDRGWVITSGTFVNLYLYRTGNFAYDEQYFIDKFEIDLCKQFTNAGYKILMYHASVLHQRLGEDSGHDHPNHSPIRHYYLARNRLYFNRKFYRFNKRWILNIIQSGRHTLLVILYENNKCKKVVYCIKGWRDYFKSQFGKANENL